MEDLKCPTNTILNVRLTSDGYSADSSMDVGARDIAVFAEGLKEVYDKLEGTVRLEEPYGEHNFIVLMGSGTWQSLSQVRHRAIQDNS